MADPGISTQNFLRLFLGGAQKGVDVMQERESRALAQAPDIYTAMQQLAQRGRIFDEEQGLRQETLDFQKQTASQERADRQNEAIFNQFQVWKNYMLNKAKLEQGKVTQQSLIDLRKSQIDKNEKLASATGAQKVSDKRQALQFQINNETGNEANYDIIDEAEYGAKTAPERAMYQPLFSKVKDVDGADVEVRRYRRLKGGSAENVRRWRQELDKIGMPDAASQNPLMDFMQASPGSFYQDEDEASVIDALYRETQ